MRALIALMVIVYIVGVGVVLSPTIQAKWNGAWPVRAYHSIVERG
jgi:hypothetical protein